MYTLLEDSLWCVICMGSPYYSSRPRPLYKVQSSGNVTAKYTSLAIYDVIYGKVKLRWCRLGRWWEWGRVGVEMEMELGSLCNPSYRLSELRLSECTCLSEWCQWINLASLRYIPKCEHKKRPSWNIMRLIGLWHAQGALIGQSRSRNKLNFVPKLARLQTRPFLYSHFML